MRGRYVDSPKTFAYRYADFESVTTAARHDWIVNEFLDWLDDGPAPATTLEDNLRTAAMVFGAIESARIGQTVDVEVVAS